MSAHVHTHLLTSCPSCKSPLVQALVGLDYSMLICPACGWEETDRDPSVDGEDQAPSPHYIEKAKVHLAALTRVAADYARQKMR